MNKPPSAIYFRSGNAWRKQGEGSTAFDAEPIEPSAGLLFRKAAAGTVSPIRWANDPTYDVTAP